ncbi:hypothetical protein LIER_03342 [Lithospermum erythrorhizon]|uniref:Uncharacterized protein n=1 Tax=Lithospermum erythrorhizon TaxID=34254 RepID=A0AAV3NSX9_LITER
MYEGELYRKSFEGPLLLSMSQENIQKVLYKVHIGWCGSHIGGRFLATKVTRTDFFWPITAKGKWVEAAPLAKIKGEGIVRFLWKQVLTCFGETPFILVYGTEAVLPAEKYKHLMDRSYNHIVKSRQFRLGDLVLKLYSVSHPKDVNKLNPKWKGPYRVSHILGTGTYELEETDGKPVPQTWYASKLSKFYC